jgi:hypothetical protein|tara:strand:+ start:2207 stop:2398 length:192 start_codon:yes stop_codon:yes gene_type:complete
MESPIPDRFPVKIQFIQMNPLLSTILSEGAKTGIITADLSATLRLTHPDKLRRHQVDSISKHG